MEDNNALAELLDKIDNLKELMSNGFVKFSFNQLPISSIFVWIY